MDLLIEAIRERVELPGLPDSAARGALLWVLENNPPPPDGYTVSPWLLRILRKACEETGRRIGLDGRVANGGSSLDTLIAEAEPFQVAHACISGMLSELNEDHAMVLRQLELANVSPTQLAIKLTTTPNVIRVRARQARVELYERMIDACRQR